jgi:localization factor PodJL
MRSAYPGVPGYNSQGVPFDSGAPVYPDGGDRLLNIRRAIDSIEQRLGGAGMSGPGMDQPAMNYGTPGYHPAPYASVPQGAAHGGVMQAQYNQLAGQAAAVPPYNQPPQMVPGYAMPHGSVGQMEQAASEIARRQQMLNSPLPSDPLQQSARSGAAAASMDGVARQLHEMKQELADVKSQVSKPIAVQQSVPQQEIDRIARTIADLQAQSNPAQDTLDRLGKELGQMRGAMKNDMHSAIQKGIQSTMGAQSDNLSARLEALGKDVRSAIDSQMQGQQINQTADLARRLDELSQNIDQISVQSANAVTPQVDSLSAQLDALRVTIDDLPQTLAISRIEDRLDELSEQLGGLSAGDATDGNSNAGHVGAEEFASIESRLDEVARALVAVSNSGRDAPNIDLTSVDRVEARMAELARTLDAIAENNSTSDLEKLAVRIEGLTDRLGSFEKYAENGDLGGATAMFAAPDTGVIEDQLKALNARLDEAVAQPSVNTMEEQIRQLSQRVEEASNIHSTSAQVSNLEAQIGLILRQMGAQDGVSGVDFAPLEARLGQIENQLQANQNFSLEAAQQAAQHAVSMMGPQSQEGSVIEALSHDLKSLQLIAEGGAAQNSESVLHIQQTLQQVVGRLATIEGSLDGASARLATFVASESVAMPAAATLPDTRATTESSERLVNESAFVSDGLNDVAKADGSRATVQKAGGEVGVLETPPTPATPKAKVDQSAPTAAQNKPLEPGSAAPNIDDLVQRASAKLNQDQAKHAAPESQVGAAAKNTDEPAKDDTRPDAVAAARRALQATTAEMTAFRQEAGKETGKSSSSSGLGKVLGSLPGLSPSRLRKPLVLGAAALLLAIVTYKSIGLFTGADRDTVAKLDSPAVEMSVAEEEISNASTNASGVDETAAVKPDQPKKIVRSVEKEPAATVEESQSPIIDGARSLAAADAESQSQPAVTPEPVNVPADTVEEPAAMDPVPAPVVAAKPLEVPAVSESVESASQAATAYEVASNAGPAALVAAASAGVPKALFQLGMRYSDGDNVKRNMTESAKWFQHAAEAGFAPAEYSIGSLYEKGIGVERDVVKAKAWYEKAAQQGNARAMHNLAVIYAMGNPPAVQPDMDTAVEWFVKAANLGIKDSQFNLGILYGQGRGAPQNLIESYKWFALAAKTGDTDANKKRDEVANAMDPDDLDDARKEVNNWAPRKLDEAANRLAVPDEWKGASGNANSSAGPVVQNAFVRQAQSMLNQRGFDVGNPDGMIGPKTKRAIMEFQKSAGIPVTGEVDKNLLQALDL